MKAIDRIDARIKTARSHLNAIDSTAEHAATHCALYALERLVEARLIIKDHMDQVGVADRRPEIQGAINRLQAWIAFGGQHFMVEARDILNGEEVE